MESEERNRLMQEIQKLKDENETLVKTVAQLNQIVNRLISRYIVQDADC